jgi:GH25 family lysozyme M1 (1,4-beta-N-acetylmuramidase)
MNLDFDLPNFKGKSYTTLELRCIHHFAAQLGLKPQPTTAQEFLSYNTFLNEKLSVTTIPLVDTPFRTIPINISILEDTLTGTVVIYKTADGEQIWSNR